MGDTLRYVRDLLGGLWAFAGEGDSLGHLTALASLPNAFKVDFEEFSILALSLSLQNGGRRETVLLPLFLDFSRHTTGLVSREGESRQTSGDNSQFPIERKSTIKNIFMQFE